MLRYGTAHFADRLAAVAYYRGQGFASREAAFAAVNSKHAAGEIAFGAPPCPAGGRVYLDPVEGRYWVEEPEAGQTLPPKLFTRAQYMNRECTHRQYYGQFVTENTRALVGRVIGLQSLRLSKDEHFNDIPLARWDGMVNGRMIPAGTDAKLRSLGDWLSMAAGVCILKEAAQQLLERTRAP